MEMNRLSHQDQMKAQLADWRKRLDVLEGSAAKAEAGAKSELDMLAHELRELETSAKKLYDELSTASADTWSSLKTTLDGTWARVSNSVDSTWGRWLARQEPVKREHKKQLHDRVEERRRQLTATLLGLQLDPQSAKSERASAIEGALAALQTHVSGGWDVVDESESAALVRWLDSSKFLFDSNATSGEVAPPAAVPSPAVVENKTTTAP